MNFSRESDYQKYNMKLSNMKIVTFIFSVSVTTSPYTQPKIMYLPEILRLGFLKYSVPIQSHMQIYFMYSGFGC